MFRRIVVPLDGSPPAEEVLARFGRVIGHPAAEIHIVRALGFQAPEDTCTKSLARELAEDAEQYLAKVERRLVDDGVRVRMKVIEDSAAEGVLDYATRSNASMIVMSTHGRTGFSRWLLGSVAEKVLRAATVPVLLWRSMSAREAGPVRSVLVPIEASLAVLEPAAELAAHLDAGLTLYHRSPRPGDDPDADALLKAAARSASRVPVRTRLEYSEPGEKFDPAAAILERCAEGRFDLIAMATHGRSGIRRWALGSVTEKVLRHADVPMLVVRGG